MPSPYHHGSLRAELLTTARQVLLTDGMRGVTMRGLAARLGVSHAAPRRHFADLDALLDAVAAEGFEELTEILNKAATGTTGRERLSAYVRGHIGFASANGALVELMFSKEARVAHSSADAAAARFFAEGRKAIGDTASGPPGALVYMLTATTEGIGSLIVSGRLPSERIDDVIDLVVDVLLPVVQTQITHSHSTAPT